MSSYLDGIEGFMEARKLPILLNFFVDLLGLQINCAKSTFVGFDQTQDKGIQCIEALGTPMGSLPMQYMGLPLMWKRMLITDLQPTVEKVENRSVVERGG